MVSDCFGALVWSSNSWDASKNKSFVILLDDEDQMINIENCAH